MHATMKEQLRLRADKIRRLAETLQDVRARATLEAAAEEIEGLDEEAARFLLDETAALMQHRFA
jgi:hypothetical protein